MTRVEKLKQTISRNPAARILLYLAALVMPVAAYCNINTNAFGGAFEKLGFHNVMWLGFYSCLILLWACNYKCREKLVNLVLVILNLLPIIILLKEISIYGFWGIAGVIVLTIVPFFNFRSTFIQCAILIIMVGIAFYLNGDWEERWNRKDDVE
jgi:hypothetical protein